jgi:hypothetical protein
VWGAQPYITSVGELEFFFSEFSKRCFTDDNKIQSFFRAFTHAIKFRENNSEKTREHCCVSWIIISEYHSEFRDKFRDFSLNKIQRK